MPDEKVRTYRGFDIYSERTGLFRFYFKTPSEEDEVVESLRYSDSMKGIDRLIDEHVRETAKSTKIAIACLHAIPSGYGIQAVEPRTVTGINLHTRDMTGLGKNTYGQVYPVHPWIQRQLDRLIAIGEERHAIEDELRPFEIRKHRGDYRGVNDKNYDDEIAKLQAEFAEKLAKLEARAELADEARLFT